MTDPTQHDEVVDALLSRHFAAATTSFEPPQQPLIGSLLSARRPRNRWWAPAAVAGGLIAAATATVLVVSSTAPSSAPKVGVAPSGPSTSASTTGSTTNDDGGEPAAQITVSGREYRLVGAVAWFGAFHVGRTVGVAVARDLDLADDCDSELYRVTATRRDSELVLTSYRYDPMTPPVPIPAPSDVPTICVTVAPAPFVAAVELDFDPPGSAVDGARSSTGLLPLTAVLVPSALPDGMAAGSPNETYPQRPDPDRPALEASIGFGTDARHPSVFRMYRSGTQFVSVWQGVDSFIEGRTKESKTSVDGRPAQVVAAGRAGEYCVDWTDSTAGKMEVCGNLSGGADAVVAVARSIYAGSSTPGDPSSTGNTSTGPAQRIILDGITYQLTGDVPWISAMRLGSVVAVNVGEESRSSCAQELYRVTAARRGESLALTAHRYEPVGVDPPEACAAIALPPYVAALDLKNDLAGSTPDTVLDGAQTAESSRPLAMLLRPTALPTSAIVQPWNENFPQLPDRSTFPAWIDPTYQSITQSYRVGGGWVRISQAMEQYSVEDGPVVSTTVGGYRAQSRAVGGTSGTCLRWTDRTAGKVELCASLPGGADAVLALARSIY